MYQEVKPPESPPDLSTDGVVWLRPEYQGRQGELVTLAAGARLVGVSAAAVSNWHKRYPEEFPQLVLLTGPPHKRTKWAVAVELVAFARDQRARARDRSGPKGPQRAGAEIAAEQAAHYEEVVRTLTDREQRQAKALARTRAARRTADQKLARAHARLAAEIDAVARLGIQKDRRTMTTEKEPRP